MAITLYTTGYCEAADVGALWQQFTIDANSSPNTTEVESWITEDFHELNAILRGAGYIAPISAAAGSLTAGVGSIVTDGAAQIGDTAIALTGSGGTLVGQGQPGDILVLAGDTQRYVLTELVAAVGGDIWVAIAPALELAVSSGVTVTYTASGTPAELLKKLNAYMTTARVVMAAYSANGDSGDEATDPIIAERDRLIDNLRGGVYSLPTIPEVYPDSFGTSKLIRA